MGVNGVGISLRGWLWPGNSNDLSTVQTVKAYLAGSKLNRVIWAERELGGRNRGRRERRI